VGSSASVRVTQRQELFEELLETVPDAMVLCDHSGRISLVNRQAAQLFGYELKELSGKKVEVLVPAGLRAQHRQRRSSYFASPHVRPIGEPGSHLRGRRKDGTEFPAEISVSPLQIDGKLMVWAAIRDVSERERLISELRTALDDLKLLRGLLSICASCKRIRDERGNWQQLEFYIQSHSEAKFTHGLCEDCIRKLYPRLTRSSSRLRLR
jgi:PAS domain S-box-containing protein